MVNAPLLNRDHLGVSLPSADRLGPRYVVELGELTERSGLGLALAGEVNAAEFFGLAGALAERTSRIRLGSGVIPFGTRSATLAAMGFSTLSGLAPGRVIAGFGVSTEGIVSGWHGRPHLRSPDAVSEFVDQFRVLVKGNRLANGFRIGLAGSPEPQIMIGTVSELMLNLAGRLADGVTLPPWVSRRTIPDIAARLQTCARITGRPKPELIATVWAYCASQPTAALQRLRSYTLTYAAVGPYRRLIETVFPDLKRAEQHLSERNREAAEMLVTDDVIGEFAVVGSGTAAMDRAAELTRLGADSVVFALLALGPGDTESPGLTIRDIARAAD